MKCTHCKKKLTLVQTLTAKCKCTKHACPKCKPIHVCEFNYKQEQKDFLTKKLERVVQSKITKI